MSAIKIKLTRETVTSPTGEILYRIKAIEDIPARGVKKGDKGGFIASLEVKGNARVSGNAWVSGNALVYGNARVSDNARVSGNARVTGNAQVFGDALVSGNAQVYGDAQVYGNAQVSGNAWVSGDAQVSGDVIVDSLAAILVIIVAVKYSVTITREHVQVGCQLFKRSEIKSMNKAKAKKLGLEPEFYDAYIGMIKAGMKLVK